MQVNKSNLPLEVLFSLYESMLRIRCFEEKIAELYPQQEMKTPVHLCLGQEAVAAGICLHLKRQDYLFSNHRGHGHYLAKGGDMIRLAAELYGKAAGCSHGYGGSMHVVDPDAGVCGTSAIVGGGLPLAVGAALGTRMRGEDRVSVVFFGDGAVDEGVFHESLNFAALKKLAVIFVCENNLYATCSHRKNRQAFSHIFALAQNYDIPAQQIDGNDVIAVYRAGAGAVQRARQGKGPAFLECLSYRWRGHVGPECDAVMGYRGREEIEAWQERCPLRALRDYIGQVEQIGQELAASRLAKMAAAIQRQVREAFILGNQGLDPTAAGF